MSTPIPSRSRCALLLRWLAAGLLTGAASQAMAFNVTLCAEPHAQTLPGAAGVPMWGYRQVGATADCDANAGVGTASPGPVISVPAGDSTLAITLVNKLNVPTSVVLAAQALPSDGGAAVMAADVVGPACVPNPAAASTDAAHPVNCRVRSFTGETAPGTSRTYTFSSIRPGTYLYQSGTHPQVQIQMGLFGMARQDAQPAGSAARLLYASAAAGFDVDVPVVLSEIDVNQHLLIASTLGSADPTTWKSGSHSTLGYAPRFFLVNGQVFNGVDGNGAAATDLPVSAPAGSRIVLRLANAGLQSRSLMLNNGTWKLLTEDGNAYAAPREQATVLLPAGKTSDALLISNAASNGSVSRSLAFFDRRGGTDNADGSALGGQVARLALSAPTGPALQAIPNQVVNEGTAMSLQVLGSNITAGYTLSGTLPAGMAIGNAGLITWPVPFGTPVPTAYDVTVNGSDGATTVSQSFNLRVNHTPTIAASGPYAVTHGSVTVPAAGLLTGAADPDLDPLSAVPAAAASAGTLALNANGSFTWTGPQPASGTSAVTFGVAARDPNGLLSAPTTVTLNVAANVAPVAGSGSLASPTAITLKGNALQRLSLAYQLTAPSPLQLGFATLVTASDADGQVAPATFQASVTRVTSGTGAVIALPGGYAEASAQVSADGSTLTFRPRSIAGLLVLGTLNGASSSLGVYRITYTVKDDQGLPSNTATLYVRIF